MLTLKKIKTFWYKLMAKQLRRPSGVLAKLTGKKMNESNEFMYRFTLNSLPVNDGDKILEIGFGNGRFFSLLNAKAKNLEITGIDLSHEMVTEAVKNNRGLFESGTMKVKIGNSDALPFDDENFDTVFCMNVIDFWENPSLHLQEIYRVLKPGGYFIAGFRPKENMQQFPFAEYGFTLYTENEWSNLLQVNGFISLHSSHNIEPQTEFLGKKIQLESVCIVAKK